MRRFLLSSKKFTGTAELVYHTSGHLMLLDLSKAKMDTETIRHFKAAVSPHIDTLTERFTADVTVVEAAFEITFEMFWNAYDLKIHRKRCEAIWERMSVDKKVAAWMGVQAYDAYLQSTGYRKKADPENYLKKEYWLNEWK